MSAKSLDQFIKSSMQSCGINSMRSLEKQLDIPHGTLFSLIKRNSVPRHTTLKKLADFFNVPLADLSAIARKPAKPINPLADTLSHLMQTHYYGQRDIARLSGIRQSVIGAILQGRVKNPRPETLKKLADFFNVPLADLSAIARKPAKPINPLADTLSHLMQVNCLNQSDVEKLAGVTRTTIKRLLKGETKNPSHQILMKLANCFDITVEQLMGKSPLPNKYKIK